MMDVSKKPLVLVAVKHRGALTPVFMQIARGGYGGYELKHCGENRDVLIAEARALAAARKPVAIITDSEGLEAAIKREIKMRSMLIVFSQSSSDLRAVFGHDLHKVVRVDTKFTPANDFGAQACNAVVALDALYRVPA